MKRSPETSLAAINRDINFLRATIKGIKEYSDPVALQEVLQQMLARPFQMTDLYGDRQHDDSKSRKTEQELIDDCKHFKLGKAIRSFETALSLNPGNMQAQKNLDQARSNLQQFRETYDSSMKQGEIQEHWFEFEAPGGRIIRRTMFEIESHE